MHILLTNNTLGDRAGTECYIRDIAVGLLRRGHRPIAYSTKLGVVAEELRSKSIPVVDDLSKITITPDVIHAQHHVEAMSALLYFSDVPALYICHGWRPWEELPPRFPRILQYGAIDEATYDRLTIENSIPADRVVIIHNSVDLENICRRGPLPDRLKRAVIFSNYVTLGSPYYRAIREACDLLSIELDVMGVGVNQPIAQPGEVLGQYDLVFAQGRSALEAMAAGAAVMICSSRAFGPLVTETNFDFLRRRNFGIRTLCYPVGASTVVHELSHYSPLSAQLIAQRTRSLCSLEETLDQLLELYQSVIQEQRSSTSDREDERRAAARYLQELGREYKSVVALNARHLELNTLQSAEVSLTEAHKFERTNSEAERDHLVRQLEELRITHQQYEERYQMMSGSATWRMRESLLQFRFVQWIRHALRWARGLANEEPPIAGSGPETSF